jgi:Zn-dependent protease
MLFAFDSGTSPAKMLLLIGVLSFSLLFHEYGHALTALFFGRNPEINLVAFGGNATYNGIGLSDKQQFLITLNGPLFTAFLVFLSYVCLQFHFFHNYFANYFLFQTMRLNIFWGLANIIPLYPLDGGHLLRYFLKARFGDEKGLRISLTIGNVCAVLASTYFFCTQCYYFGFIFLYYGFQNLQAYNHQKQVGPNNFSLFHDGVAAANNNDMENAKSIFKKLLKSKDSYYRTSATEEMAHLLYKEGKNKEAYRLLRKEDPETLKKGKCLLCQLAYEEKDYALIERFSREIYEIDSTFEMALLNSKAFACLHQPELAAGWLCTAARFNEAPIQTIDDVLYDPTFDTVRNSNAFKHYIQQFSAGIP